MNNLGQEILEELHLLRFTTLHLPLGNCSQRRWTKSDGRSIMSLAIASCRSVV